MIGKISCQDKSNIRQKIKPSVEYYKWMNEVQREYERRDDGVFWAHQDLNLGPTGYEPVALPLSYRPCQESNNILYLELRVRQ